MAISNEIISDEKPLIYIKLNFANKPMKNEANKILRKVINNSFKPNDPIFLLRLVNNRIEVKIAAIEVANANPPIPKNLESTIFKTIFNIKPIEAFIIGVFVSCIA